MRLRAGCRGYSLDAYNLMSMCSSTSKEDPFESPMPCSKFVTGKQHPPLRIWQDSVSQSNIHFISTPIDLTAVKSSTALDPTVSLLKNTIFSVWPPYRRAMPAGAMGVLELWMQPHNRRWPCGQRQQDRRTSIHEKQSSSSNPPRAPRREQIYPPS